MVIAALISFALLLIAWVVAPARESVVVPMPQPAMSDAGALAEAA
jgi:hypothetical protein